MTSLDARTTLDDAQALNGLNIEISIKGAIFEFLSFGMIYPML